MQILASAAKNTIVTTATDTPRLRKELGLRDLVLAQILCVVGSAWVGVAAKLGATHVVFWLAAMLLFYLPLAAVVIHLNAAMPLEGGLYQWAKHGLSEFLGFLTAWNLWTYAVVCVASVLFVIPTDLSYIIGVGAEWIPANRMMTASLIGFVVLVIVLLAISGLHFSKWLHNAGSLMISVAYAVLLLLPLWSKAKGQSVTYTPIPWAVPQLSWFSLAIFGQMTVGALSGFEYVAIMAGECKSAARTIGQSVLLSAPVIALMFILGTSSVLCFVGNRPINLIGPIPQTFRLAFGENSNWAAPAAISLLLMRAVAAASLIFTGLTRLPMTAGWDHLLPSWFNALHPRWKTPVNSILFVAVLVMVLVILSTAGVHEQEAMQLLQNATTAHYAITYVILFAIPLFAGQKFSCPPWLRFLSVGGLISSLIAVFIAVYPVITVSSPVAYACKIAGVVLASNGLAIFVYYSWSRKHRLFPIELAEQKDR
jgi:glutamate:GABA antiporter